MLRIAQSCPTSAVSPALSTNKKENIPSTWHAPGTNRTSDLHSQRFATGTLLSQWLTSDLRVTGLPVGHFVVDREEVWVDLLRNGVSKYWLLLEARLKSSGIGFRLLKNLSNKRLDPSSVLVCRAYGLHYEVGCDDLEVIQLIGYES